MKKLLSFLLIFTLITITSTNVSAINRIDIPTQSYIEYIDDDLYIETIITDATPHNNSMSTLAATNTITKTKTDYYKNSNGKVLWSVSVTGTFTYNGSTSKCTSCSHSTTSPGSSWSIKSATSYKAANYATASATATYKNSTGATQDYTRTVTLQCSKNGTIS